MTPLRLEPVDRDGTVFSIVDGQGREVAVEVKGKDNALLFVNAHDMRIALRILWAYGNNRQLIPKREVRRIETLLALTEVK
ncbi:MAG: hypothetical protein ACYTEQ_01695 [Planctomycetota bacterium]|jgi:hypothetical protein